MAWPNRANLIPKSRRVLIAWGSLIITLRLFRSFSGISIHSVDIQLRTTVADMGPQLFSHLLELNETQEGVLFVAFSAARDDKLPLLDLKDLRTC